MATRPPASRQVRATTLSCAVKGRGRCRRRDAIFCGKKVFFGIQKTKVIFEGHKSLFWDTSVFLVDTKVFSGYKMLFSGY